MPTDQPDRYHNRQEDSPESLRQSIEALTKVVAALDRKLDVSTERLSTDVDGARYLTRSLAADVARMGEVLVNRIDGAGGFKIVAGPERRRGATASIWIVALAFILALAAGLLGLSLSRDRNPALMYKAALTSKRIVPPPPAMQRTFLPTPPPLSTPRTVSRRAAYAWRLRHRPSRPADDTSVDPMHADVNRLPDYSSRSHELVPIQARPPTGGA